jgi:tRNA threonylcarbamoyladenosine biosynthesis protein TsaB
MLILGIETATPWGSVALCEDGELIFEFTVKIGKGSGEHLLALLRQIMVKTGRKLAELNLIAVGTGPGSYTGIRIGLAAVAGLAEGLQVPVYGVNTLRIIAENARYGSETAGMVAVALDARRTEVYAALYQAEPGGLQEIMPPQTVRAEAFAVKLGELKKVMLCGDGGKRYSTIFQPIPTIKLAPDRWDRPLAGWAAEIARREWDGKQTTDYLNIAPEYLRKVEAELRLEEKLRGAKSNANVCGRLGRSNHD